MKDNIKEKQKNKNQQKENQKKNLSPEAIEKNKLGNDLTLIGLLSLGALALYLCFSSVIDPIIFSKNGTSPLLIRVILAALIQFGIAGFGISVVAIFRKEKFSSFGLKKDKAVIAILLSILCFVPYIIFTVLSGNFESYLPLQMVNVTRETLASNFPTNIIGMIIIATAWGFFEGFNYVVISDKLNKLYPVKNRWLNVGAIVCAIMCVLIHGAVGVTAEGIIEMFLIMFIIYGMLMVRNITGNAWGSVFIFVFLWNAF